MMVDDRFAEIMEREGIDALLEQVVSVASTDDFVAKATQVVQFGPAFITFLCAVGESPSCAGWLVERLGTQQHSLVVMENDLVKPGAVFLLARGRRIAHTRWRY